MKQDTFTRHYAPLWQSLEDWLNYHSLSRFSRRKRLKQNPALAEELAQLDFPSAYRQLCHHLALAQSRSYSHTLIDRLNQLVLRGHQVLYAQRPPVGQQILLFFTQGLPRLVRQERAVIFLASALFFGSFFGLLLAVQVSPQLAYSIISGEQLVSIEQMYDPELRERFGREREADSDVLMFGFYIRNNTSIGFQSFAGGLTFGLGTVFIMLFNGIFIGTVAGHLTHLGYIETFWGFVAGHSAFELTAIVIAGGAGFKLAQALLLPGQKSRRLALLDNSKIAIKLVYGAATLFFMAAFVEAFWSSQAIIPVMVKYVVGIGLWVLTLAYFISVGRVGSTTSTAHATSLSSSTEASL